MTQPHVAIVLLTRNQKEHTIECLRSLEKLEYPNFKIIVVDNGSTDGTPREIRTKFPHVTLIENEENLGFAEGSNVGIRRAITEGADYVLLLNNDTIVAPDLLTELVRVAEADTRIGIVGPKIYYYHEPDRIQSVGGRIDWKRATSTLIGTGEIDSGQYDQIREVDFVSGCALLIRRSVIEKVGLMDPAYFLYYDEVDWNVRASRAGFRLVCVPSGKVWHKDAVSSGKGSPFLNYYIARNKLLFAQKNAGLMGKTFMYLLGLKIAAENALRLLFPTKRENALAVLKGIFDFYKGRFGRRY